MFRSESQGKIQGGMEYSGAHCYFSGGEDMVESILEKAEDQGSTTLAVLLLLSRKYGEIMKTAGISVHNLKDLFMRFVFNPLSSPAAGRWSFVFLDF